MHPIIRNTLAVVVGFVVGSVVNMAFIAISGSIIAPPAGADVSTMEGLRASLHLYEPKHFIFPFIAHALGTLVGALVAALIATRHKMTFAIVIGVLFLIGGFINVVMLPSPLWFSLLDLVVAYLPMAYIGGRLAIRGRSIS